MLIFILVCVLWLALGGIGCYYGLKAQLLYGNDITTDDIPFAVMSVFLGLASLLAGIIFYRSALKETRIPTKPKILIKSKNN